MVIDEIDKELFDNSRMHFFFWFMRKIWIPLFLHKGGKRDFVRIDKDWFGNSFSKIGVDQIRRLE